MNLTEDICDLPFRQAFVAMVAALEVWCWSWISSTSLCVPAPNWAWSSAIVSCVLSGMTIAFERVKRRVRGAIASTRTIRQKDNEWREECNQKRQEGNGMGMEQKVCALFISKSQVRLTRCCFLSLATCIWVSFSALAAIKLSAIAGTLAISPGHRTFDAGFPMWHQIHLVHHRSHQSHCMIRSKMMQVTLTFLWKIPPQQRQR